MNRVEPILLGLFLACWIAALIHYGGLVSLAGLLSLPLRGVYSVAAVVGWLAGNIYVHRRRQIPRWLSPLGRRLLVVYLVGPIGLVFLLWALAPRASQQALPLVPFLSAGIVGIFFLVPVAFRRWPRPRRLE